jgi:WD40 repeat protein
VSAFRFSKNIGIVFVTCGDDRTIRFWIMNDVASMISSNSTSVPHVVYCSDTDVSTVSISKDGRFTLAAGGNSLHLFRSPIPGLQVESKKLEQVTVSGISVGIRSATWGEDNKHIFLGLEDGSAATLTVPSRYHRVPVSQKS